MLKDITIGQYYPTESGRIHAAAFSFYLYRCAQVPLKYILRGLKTIMIILAFSLIFNIFFITGAASSFRQFGKSR